MGFILSLDPGHVRNVPGLPFLSRAFHGGQPMPKVSVPLLHLQNVYRHGISFNDMSNSTIDRKGDKRDWNPNITAQLHISVTESLAALLLQRLSSFPFNVEYRKEQHTLVIDITVAQEKIAGELDSTGAC